MTTKLMTKYALESSDSSAINETEIVLYAKIENFSGLSEADEVEDHIQLESEFKNGYKCRVRQVTKTDGSVNYQFTFKVPLDAVETAEANKEYTNEVSKEFFEGFKSVTSRMLMKTRFTFNSTLVELNVVDEEQQSKVVTLPNIKYEVDVYKDVDHKSVEWCKIDVEVDDILSEVSKHTDGGIKINLKASHLPFKPINILMSSSDDASTKDFISKLWTERYTLPI